MIENKEKIICFCLGTTEDTIVDAVRKGAHSLKTIKEMTKACTGDQCEELNPKDRCCSVSQHFKMYHPSALQSVPPLRDCFHRLVVVIDQWKTTNCELLPLAPTCRG